MNYKEGRGAAKRRRPQSSKSNTDGITENKVSGEQNADPKIQELKPYRENEKIGEALPEVINERTIPVERKENGIE